MDELKEAYSVTKSYGVFRWSNEVGKDGRWYQLVVLEDDLLRISTKMPWGARGEGATIDTRLIKAKYWARTEQEAKAKVVALLEKEVEALRRRKTKLYQMMEQYR